MKKKMFLNTKKSFDDADSSFSSLECHYDIYLKIEQLHTKVSHKFHSVHKYKNCWNSVFHAGSVHKQKKKVDPQSFTLEVQSVHKQTKKRLVQSFTLESGAGTEDRTVSSSDGITEAAGDQDCCAFAQSRAV